MDKLRHFALIPDGIRRWAVQNSVSVEAAYDAVAAALIRISDTVFAHDIVHFSVYVLSKNNLRRQADELDATLRSHIRIFRDVLPLLAHRWNARVRHVGDPTILPADYADALQQVCETKLMKPPSRIIYICAGYSLDWELSERLCASEKRDKSDCVLPADVDLLLRTGGEMRLSGFLPLQLQYAELFFVDKLFPDLESEDVESVIRAYGRRERRFGR